VDWNGLALAYRGQGYPTAALGAARRAVSENPAFLAAQLTFGRLCAEAGYAQDAIDAFEAARDLAPHDADVARSLADAYRRGGRVKDAVLAADRAVRIDPRNAESFLCLGEALLANDAALPADRMFCKALVVDSRLALAECGRGGVHLLAARWGEARDAFERALLLAPGCPEARYNIALLDLRGEAYAAGFAGYCAIMDTSEQGPRYHYYHSGVPVWDGTALGARRLVVAYEQGLGNQIQMARFFDALQHAGESVAIEAPPALLGLLRRNFPALTFTGFTNWQPLEAMDVHLPLMQLPAAWNVAHESEFAMREPYLKPDPARVAAFRERSALEAGVRHVGIVWHGNRANARDRWRAVPLPAWKALADVPGVRFHSLQFETAPDELALSPFPLVATHELIQDLDDTAALMSLMDLVITVDTSSVHLAGALGRPVWMPQPLLGDYRWGVDRTDSPWYPQLRIFRQRTRDDWEPVFEEIAETLARA
jgi:Flp pilus assembly protein TadD